LKLEPAPLRKSTICEKEKTERSIISFTETVARQLRGRYSVSEQIRMMLNEDDDLVFLDILFIFTFNYFYHLSKDIFGSIHLEKCWRWRLLIIAPGDKPSLSDLNLTSCGDGQMSLCCKPPRHVDVPVVGIVIGPW
jgi:hypothetical protein